MSPAIFLVGLSLDGNVRRSQARWAEIAEPIDDRIGSVRRELQRAAGLWNFEGVPGPPRQLHLARQTAVELAQVGRNRTHLNR